MTPPQDSVGPEVVPRRNYQDSSRRLGWAPSGHQKKLPWRLTLSCAYAIPDRTAAGRFTKSLTKFYWHCPFMFALYIYLHLYVELRHLSGRSKPYPKKYAYANDSCYGTDRIAPPPTDSQNLCQISTDFADFCSYLAMARTGAPNPGRTHPSLALGPRPHTSCSSTCSKHADPACKVRGPKKKDRGLIAQTRVCMSVCMLGCVFVCYCIC